MDNKTRDVLLSAWHENRLAAIHMDLQDYYLRGNHKTFEAVGAFAGELRGLNVPNIWVTYPKLVEPGFVKPGCTHRNLIPCATTVEHFNNMARSHGHDPISAISEIANAHPHEAAVIKRMRSAFSHRAPSYLEQYLDDHKIDTVLMTGVAAYICVGRTINDGTALDKYDFIGVPDCINAPRHVDYKVDLTHMPEGIKNMDAFQRRFHTASSASIIDVLAPAHIETITVASQTAQAVAGHTTHLTVAMTAPQLAPDMEKLPGLPVAVMSKELAKNAHAAPAPSL